ncbi:uncharacterized protein V6R79_007028 [Siganus canaliculatus]
MWMQRQDNSIRQHDTGSTVSIPSAKARLLLLNYVRRLGCLQQPTASTITTLHLPSVIQAVRSAQISKYGLINGSIADERRHRRCHRQEAEESFSSSEQR